MSRINGHHGHHHTHRAQHADGAAPTANAGGCGGAGARANDARAGFEDLAAARRAPNAAQQRAARQVVTGQEAAARARAQAFAAADVATPAPATANATADATATRRHVGGSNVPHVSDRVSKKQHHDLPVNQKPGPEEYTPKMSARARKQLDADGVAYPKLEDEAHVNGKTRTTYAAVDRQAGVLVVGLDNAAYHSKGYKGLSKGERDFAEDMAKYAGEKGLTVVFAAHVPPTTKHKNGTNLPSDEARERLTGWMGRMQQKYPDSLWVHGHQHPEQNRNLDLDNDGNREVANVVMSGQVRNSFTKIGTFENGRVLEEYKVKGHGEKRHTELVKRTVLSRDGKVVDGATDLGAPKGVLYGVSDVHKKAGFKDYYAAIRDDALASQSQGLAIGYLDVGDHTVKNGRMPVELPRANRTYFVPGNHDYYNHDSLAGVVGSLRPKSKGELHTFVDYTK